MRPQPLFVPASPLESIRRAEFRLRVPIAERLNFTPRRGRRMWLSWLGPLGPWAGTPQPDPTERAS